MKKVLIVVAGNKGTIGQCSLNLFRAFKERQDVEVKCVGIHRYENGFHGFDDCVFFSDEHKHGLIPQIKWLKQIKNDFQPDMTISTLFSVNTLNALSGGKDFKVGIFHSPHKQQKASGYIRYIYSLLQYWLLFPKLNFCSCVSKEVEKDLCNFVLFKKNRIRTVYNIHFVDEIIEKAKENVTDIPSSPYFIYCGRLDANKAPIRAIKAISLLKLDEKLVFIGKGEKLFVEGVQKKVETLGLSDRVVFLGERENPYPYIKRAKGLVSCSYSEGLPGVIIEALALGVPVVSTNSSRGIWEILSVDDSYDNSLGTIFETKYGIITSNNAAKDSSKEESDIENLAKGFQMIEKYQQMPESEFLRKVNGDTITNQYLSLI